MSSLAKLPPISWRICPKCGEMVNPLEFGVHKNCELCRAKEQFAKSGDNAAALRIANIRTLREARA